MGERHEIIENVGVSIHGVIGLVSKKLSMEVDGKRPNELQSMEWE